MAMEVHIFRRSCGCVVHSTSASTGAPTWRTVASGPKGGYEDAQGGLGRPAIWTMTPLLRLTPRIGLILLHDLVATAAAIIASFYIRFEAIGLAQREDLLIVVLPGFVAYAGLIYAFFDLYRSKWRFASLPDLFNIVRAVTVLAVSLLVLDYILVAPNVYGTFFFGKITIALYWFLQTSFLGGPRVAYRYFRYTRTRQHAKSAHPTPTLVLGRAADVEVLLRAIESGAVSKIWPVGILSPSRADQRQAIRGVAVLGTFDDLERVTAELDERASRVTRLLLTPSALAPEAKPETILMRARRLGLATSRLPSLDEGGEAVQLAPVAVEDLLLRPSVKIDYRRLESFIKGRAVVVTGGGGSIGAEICRRVVTFGAARLLVIENSEPALHAVLEALATKPGDAQIEGRIADVRDRERVFAVLGDFRPQIVFHAAALKHVPLLERDWGEGVKTNVFGSVNVADASVEAGADALVMVSTDKAIEPVSVLGATKRFAEMYCQALDADLLRRSGPNRRLPRLIAVRFGNVLASNGSVVPKFKAQIEAGGPVTVTHPDMVRYFMTIREACDLVVTAASHALLATRSDVAVYVLNMGQPVKIVDLAERMIRLSGLEPGHDVQIVFTGIRPGERLNEILFAREEPTTQIGIDGIVAARPVCPALDSMRGWLVALQQALERENRAVIYRVLRDAVPDFRGEAA
jgi:FlaA1/EpsC-like NDP-sugar epimerase